MAFMIIKFHELIMWWIQYAAPLHLPSAPMTEDEKLAALGLSDQLPSAQGLLQGQSPFSVSQVCLQW